MYSNDVHNITPDFTRKGKGDLIMDELHNLECFVKAIVRTNPYCTDKRKCEFHWSIPEFVLPDSLEVRLLKSMLSNSMYRDLNIDGYSFHLFGHSFSINITANEVVLILESHGVHMEFGNVDYIEVVYYRNRAEIWGYLDGNDDSVFMLCLDSAI